MATAVLQQSGPRVFGNHGNIEALTAEDFETASIHSAAPSYVSEVPSYHTIPREATPAYSPPEQSSPPSYSFNSHRSQRRTATTASIDYYANNSSRPSLIPPADSVDEPTIGLPPVPTGPLPAIAPQLSAFRIPSWSSLAANNPNNRQYRNVAQRRASAAAVSSTRRLDISPSRMARLERVSELAEAEEQRRHRPLEDPYLVGEVAARRARAQRLARENGDEVLEMENRRWDLFLAQMRDFQPRNRRGNSSRRLL
ncbi:hypothetical protein MCOR27_010206 [Pyricularia oryzae]|uniref:Uncharacterized protein n=5 Tax=Pyricularia TaxID=48558 RepID=G5EHF2_PYRO7|nr:uncharacterized protein MGG_03066 [Pyricularia oryzae 70-15]ELQ41021.1 hypothetical protein OOU_Y34scaffold00308g32 [Pyricularia oryzae Y34]KAH8838644.1 hypothetical protein MCOR01_010073 [Pyricularia oryzae]KAI6299391.1 hypothetical protein MCOR33_004632 [Pyricularia grisea]EAQ71460.1 hypothetical protein MGCH7_ch7g867 [Pyricularia oryzae 70-15]EHA45867.1 hypothetical protein MGG_03066 [Pyricularia oryzae 70-15]